MQIKKIQLGSEQLNNNVFLAPMAGYTDYAFRNLCLDLGYGMAFTELVSAKGLLYKCDNSAILLSTKDYNKTSAQIFGSNAKEMREGCESDYLKDYKFIDINMGCPVPKIYNNGEGSALLSDVKKAEEIVKECVKSGKIITVKIRTGLKKGDNVAEDFAKMAEDSGASLITVHGRVREDYYSGEADYNAIYNAKKSVKIPVIANGGIFTKEDADKMIEETGADGVMIARGAISNPFLINELLENEKPFSLKEFIKRHLTEKSKVYGDKRTAIEFRKYVSYYFKGIPNVKAEKMRLMALESVSEILEILDKIL